MVKQTLPQTVMLQLYYALLHPLLLYDIIILVATFPTDLQKLKSLQNRAIKSGCWCKFLRFKRSS